MKKAKAAETGPGDGPSTEGRGVQSVEMGARLLSALADEGEPMMLRDLSRRVNIAPAQAHAYLLSFRKSGLVEQVEQAGRYQLGPFALQLAIARMSSFDPLRMGREAIVDLAARTGLTVALSVWGSYGPTVVDVCEGSDQVHITTRAGTVYSVAGTATGRVFAAFLPERLVKDTLRAELAEGANSRRVGRPMSYSLLRPFLAEIRSLGFSVIGTPPLPGIHPMSAPVFDHVGQIQFAITLIGPAESFDSSVDSPLVPILLQFVGRLSANLGYEPQGSGK